MWRLIGDQAIEQPTTFAWVTTTGDVVDLKRVFWLGGIWRDALRPPSQWHSTLDVVFESGYHTTPGWLIADWPHRRVRIGPWYLRHALEVMDTTETVLGHFFDGWHNDDPPLVPRLHALHPHLTPKDLGEWSHEPPLVFADWLDDQGAALGAAIVRGEKRYLKTLPQVWLRDCWWFLDCEDVPEYGLADVCVCGSRVEGRHNSPCSRESCPVCGGLLWSCGCVGDGVLNVLV